MDYDQLSIHLVLSSQLIYFFGIGILLVGLEYLYFKVASRIGIVDKPNSRSSHSSLVIRGGGVIFIFALLIWFLINGFLWPFFVGGAVAIAVISFLDDVISLNPLVRFSVQLIAVLLIFYQLRPIDWPVYALMLSIIVAVGTLNAFNFMDGINGIAGVYALVSLLSFGFINSNTVPFTNQTLILVVSISVLVFLFFNFRKRAKCFAGDVGSVTIAFILVFLLVQLIQSTNNFLWIFLFLVYGTDSVVTIIYRILRKENIFKPHRTHLYQYLSNELKLSHRVVSLLYGAFQLAINSILISSFSQNDYLLPLIFIGLYIVFYVSVRLMVSRRINVMNS